jgi:hypothetical protein
MIFEHVKAGTLMLAGMASLMAGKIVGMLGNMDPENVGLVEKYIEKGGTTLGLVLAIIAVAYFAKENKGLQKFIAGLHEKQLEETAKSTEARLAQTSAVENTNRVVGDLAKAVDKLASKVEPPR